jgi:heme-degrading monooxygenase HmoA
MYTILWEFHVPAERCRAHEAANSPQGPWAQLFGKAAGFIGIELLRCTEQAGRYVTIDRWRSRADFEAFKRDFSADYEALHSRFAGVADSETELGAFETPPAAAGN